MLVKFDNHWVILIAYKEKSITVHIDFKVVRLPALSLVSNNKLDSKIYLLCGFSTVWYQIFSLYILYLKTMSIFLHPRPIKISWSYELKSNSNRLISTFLLAIRFMLRNNARFCRCVHEHWLDCNIYWTEPCPPADCCNYGPRHNLIKHKCLIFYLVKKVINTTLNVSYFQLSMLWVVWSRDLFKENKNHRFFFGNCDWCLLEFRAQHFQFQSWFQSIKSMRRRYWQPE